MRTINYAGVEEKVWFWSDGKMGGSPLHSLFPRLFRVVVNKDSSVKECYAGEDGRRLSMSFCCAFFLTFLFTGIRQINVFGNPTHLAICPSYLFFLGSRFNRSPSMLLHLIGLGSS